MYLKLFATLEFIFKNYIDISTVPLSLGELVNILTTLVLGRSWDRFEPHIC